MDSDVLVQTIVERVLAQLQEEPDSKTTKVMVFSRYSQQIEEDILKCIHKDIELCFWDDIQPPILAERYIIPRLSCVEMADLASGRAKGAMIETILQLLLAGKTVEVIEFEYKLYEQSASPALYQLYQQHENALNSFGLVLLKPEPEPVVRFWQKLITEKDVQQAAMREVKEMHVTQDCVITPLAVDQAKLNQINIYKKL